VRVGKHPLPFHRTETGDKILKLREIVGLIATEGAEEAGEVHVGRDRVVHRPWPRLAEHGVGGWQRVCLLGLRDPGVHALGERRKHCASQWGCLREQCRPPRLRPEQLPGEDVTGQHGRAKQVRQRAGGQAAVDVRLPQPVLTLGIADAIEQRGQAGRVDVRDAVLVPEDPHLAGLPANRRCRSGRDRATDQSTDQRNQREHTTRAWQGAANHGDLRVWQHNYRTSTSLAGNTETFVNLWSAGLLATVSDRIGTFTPWR
jgi:hypothetical protein